MTKTALLVMDMQRGMVDLIEGLVDHLPRFASAIVAARTAGIPVIYVTIKFRPHHPDISPRNKMASRVASFGGFVEGQTMVEIHPDIAPAEGDIVVTKRRTSAFAGSDLELVLRSLGTENLVLAGVSTSGVVLSTLRQAADLDYRLTVLEDLCVDTDQEVHRVLMEKVFPKQADIMTANDWATGLKAL